MFTLMEIVMFEIIVFIVVVAVLLYARIKAESMFDAELENLPDAQRARVLRNRARGY